MTDIGPQYDKDDPFKAKARLHQSRYRADVLQVAYNVYGNRLTTPDAQALLNYYDGFGVREQLKARYPDFSQKRDGDMLRSEHIPFNFFGPLVSDRELARQVIGSAFGIKCSGDIQFKFEYAPEPKGNYLDDATAFDVFVKCTGQSGETIGLGIEVKYTEQSYPIGKKESVKVRELQSPYSLVTRESGCFTADVLNKLGAEDNELAKDKLRQIWRNHLLGLAIVRNKDLSRFYSITLFPSGNHHFIEAIPAYKGRLVPAASDGVKACTYEDFITAIDGDGAVQEWKEFLKVRYIVND